MIVVATSRAVVVAAAAAVTLEVVVSVTSAAETSVAEAVAVEETVVVVAAAVAAPGAEVSRNATSANRWATTPGTALLNMSDATNATNLAILPGTALKTSIPVILPLHSQVRATTVANLATYRRVAQKVTAKSATLAATAAILLGIAPTRPEAAVVAAAVVMTANVTTAERLDIFHVNAPRLVAATQATGRSTL